MAHIRGEKVGALRHDVTQTVQQRDDYLNLILLCPTHHTMVDRPENLAKYSAEYLHEIKAAHEACIHAKLEGGHKVGSKAAVAALIVPLLAENHVIWQQYGPTSELARKNPHSDAASAVWVEERLSTIVPNNRRISDLIGKGKAQFEAGEQEPIAAFLIHARSYEQWVQDEIPYHAVLRFPQAFEELMKGSAVAGA